MIRHAAIALLLLAGAGCARTPAGPPPGLSSTTTAAAQEPQRVAVLPPWLGEGVGRSAGVGTGEALASAWRELGLHEVVQVGSARRDDLVAYDPVGSNRIATPELLRIRDQLGVDAVVISRVEQYRGFDPVLIALTAHLVSTRDGSVLWSATGVFDGRRAEVQADLQAWWARSQGPAGRPLTEWRQALQSPSLFARYAGWRMAATVPPPPPPAR
ncbi:MAG: hypothetical protein RLZZ127_2373 [Planctomycetota bacterium]|jgi:hypothetical protein